MAKSGGQGNSVASGRGRRRERNVLLSKVRKIMRKVLPEDARIDKEAERTVQECVEKFIRVITNVANDKRKKDKSKRVDGQDLIWAMTTLGFKDYVEPLKIYLYKYLTREATPERMTSAVPGGGHRQMGDDDQGWIFVDTDGVYENWPAIVLVKIY